MRKMMSPAFSQRGLLEQEKIIAGTVDKFVKVLGEKAGPGTAGLNMTKWYEMDSFDILGEMAFGESFHSLESGEPAPEALPGSSPTTSYSLRSTISRHPTFLGRHCP